MGKVYSVIYSIIIYFYLFIHIFICIIIDRPYAFPSLCPPHVFSLPPFPPPASFPCLLPFPPLPLPSPSSGNHGISPTRSFTGYLRGLAVSTGALSIPTSSSLLIKGPTVIGSAESSGALTGKDNGIVINIYYDHIYY